MNQKIPGILFLLAMPCSVLLYIKVETLSGSEILGLLSAEAPDEALIAQVREVIDFYTQFIGFR